MCAHTLTHACTHAPKGRAGSPSVCTAQHDEPHSRSPSLSGHRLGDGQMDRQTDRPPCIALWAVPGRQMDGQTTARRDGRMDGQPLAIRHPTGGASSARRLHLVEDAPRRSRSGRPPLGVGPACVGPLGTAGVAAGSPAGWRCWHPAAPRLPRSASNGFHNILRPRTVNQRNKCGGICFNRWRTIFFSSFTRHTEHLLRRVPARQRTGAGSRWITPRSSCRSAAGRIYLALFRGI